MLSALKIENVAVIEKAQVLFGEGLNVLTGETGAGKSILIDSINAILGNRTSRDLVRSGTKRPVYGPPLKIFPRPHASALPMQATKRIVICCYTVRSVQKARAHAASTVCRPLLL